MKMYTESVHYVIKKRRALGVLAVMLAIVRWRRQRRHYSLRMSRRKYGPLVDRDLERQKKLNDLYNSTDKNCISQLRTTGPLRSGFDDVNKQVMLSQSTLDGLSANDRGILSKPIQFYDKLKELFSGSSADGSFMQDPFSAAETDNDDKILHAAVRNSSMLQARLSLIPRNSKAGPTFSTELTLKKEVFQCFLNVQPT
ncbi:uncharacterized protein LOC119284689 isoform X2 [Triticum dicoccoides]|uniref:uncharacterized protein LOC119284689 isoform X2 n=1 Tax=Triticum dicoccoides TaxID=85692 RepID=UPI00188F95BA|nr:uncharacterized protein LOC119284689 isoform X2 [Triticum dicoccoides]